MTDKSFKIVKFEVTGTLDAEGIDALAKAKAYLAGEVAGLRTLRAIYPFVSVMMTLHYELFGVFDCDARIVEAFSSGNDEFRLFVGPLAGSMVNGKVVRASIAIDIVELDL